VWYNSLINKIGTSLHLWKRQLSKVLFNVLVKVGMKSFLFTATKEEVRARAKEMSKFRQANGVTRTSAEERQIQEINDWKSITKGIPRRT